MHSGIIFGIGLGVAEAMDTAQRGMGLDWAGASELIRAPCAQRRGRGRVRLSGCGVGTDHLQTSDQQARGPDPETAKRDAALVVQRDGAAAERNGMRVE